MPRVFTIFNHGTDFHRDKELTELVTVLSTGMKGTEARIVQTGEPTERNPLPYALETNDPSFLICEGPGSEEISKENSSSGQKHAHPGKYNPIFNTSKSMNHRALNPKLSKKPRRMFGLRSPDYSFQKSFMGQTTKKGRTKGRIFGSGWDDNIYKAMFLVTHLQGLGKCPDIINMVGWSRGAVTCLKMANKFFEVYEDTITINIFAADPVPGGFTKETDDVLTIPPNVRNYFAVLAMDDDRANFQPTGQNQAKDHATKKPSVRRKISTARIQDIIFRMYIFFPFLEIILKLSYISKARLEIALIYADT